MTVLKRGLRHACKPCEYLRDIWHGVVSPLPEAIRMCHALVGPERLFFWQRPSVVEPRVILDAFAAAKLPADDAGKIPGSKALHLFSL